MDIATLIGIIVGMALIMVSIVMKGSLVAFIDVSSLLIVVGGTFAATMVAFSMSSLMNSLKAAITIFFQHRINHVETVRSIIKAAELVRNQGPLALEKLKSSNEFMRTAFQMVADGYNPDTVRRGLTIESQAIMGRNLEAVRILEKMAELAPAWGMIGTLIGLVIMLINLNDPSSIGPAMAVALLTTLYGALWANLMLSPSAAKLEERSDREEVGYRLILEGAVGMAASENPRIIQQRLLGLMPPEDKAALQAKGRAKRQA